MTRSALRPGPFLLIAFGLCHCASVDLARDTERALQDTLAVAAARGAFEVPQTDRAQDPQALQGEIRAQLQEPLTEWRAVQIALASDRSLWAAYEELAAAQADRVQAGLLANPKLDLQVIFFTPGDEFEGGLVQPLLDAFVRPLRERSAESHWNAAQAVLARQVLQRVFAVRRAYLAVEVAMREQEMREEILTAATLQTELASQLHEAGNVPALDLVAVRTLESAARLDLAASELAVAEARETIHSMLGLYGEDIAWSLPRPGPAELGEAPDLTAVESRAIAASLDLDELRAHVDAAAQRVDVESWQQAWGNVGFGAGARHADDDGWGFGPTLELTLPLFDPGDVAHARALATWRAAVARHWSTAVAIRSAARRLAQRVRALRGHHEHARDVYLPLRSQLVREVLRNYNAMQVGAFDVIVIRQREIEARVDALMTFHEARRAELDLQELLAGSVNHIRSTAVRVPRTEPVAPEPGEH